MNQTSIQSSYSVVNNAEKKQLLKDTFFKGSTDEEFMLFAHACERTGLDPFMKQLYPVKRWDSNLKREVVTIQTGIDGYRLIAERTGCYSPGREATFTYDKDGNLLSATSYVKKMTKDGTWHEISATAFFNEYCQRNKEGKLTTFWNKMPHGQLSKCAEALALRKAFPAECSGIYTKEEMEQSETSVEGVSDIQIVNIEQAEELEALLNECSFAYKKAVMDSLKNSKYKITEMYKLPLELYERVKNAALKKKEEINKLINSEVVNA